MAIAFPNPCRSTCETRRGMCTFLFRVNLAFPLIACELADRSSRETGALPGPTQIGRGTMEQHDAVIDTPGRRSTRGLLVKAGAAFAAVGVVACVTSGAVFLTAKGAQSQLTAYCEHVQAARDALKSTEADFYAYDDQLNMWVLVAATEANEKQLIDDTHAQAVDAQKRLQDDLGKATALTQDAQLRGALGKVHTDLAAYEGFADKVTTAMSAGDIPTASKAMTVDNADASNALMDGFATAGKRANELDAAALVDLRNGQSHVVLWAVIAVVAILAMLAALLVALQRVVVQPIRAVVAVLGRLAEGDLTGSARVRSRDELGRMSSALDVALESLRGVLATVVSSADAVAASRRSCRRPRRRSPRRRRRRRPSRAWCPRPPRRSRATCRRWRRVRSRWARRSGRSRPTRRRPAEVAARAVDRGARRRRRRWPAGRLLGRDRQRGEGDHLDRRADEPAGAERHDRGRPRR